VSDAPKAGSDAIAVERSRVEAPVAGACEVPARDASLLTRARAFVACRPCAAGWALYVAAAILLIVLFGAR